MKTSCLIILVICYEIFLTDTHNGGEIDYTWKWDNCVDNALKDIFKVWLIFIPLMLSVSYIIKAYGSLKILDNATLHYDHHKLLIEYDQGSFTFVDDNGVSEWNCL